MEEEIKEIRSRIFEQKRQLIIKIPAEIVEDFRIYPDMYDFRWIILDKGGQVTINGGFVPKKLNEKKN